MSITAIPSATNDLNIVQSAVDRRSEERHQATYRPCCVISAKKVSMGLIRNYSDGGARIEVDADLEVGYDLTYFWEADTCISARVIWREGRAIGVGHVEKMRKAPADFPLRSVRVPCESEATCWINGQIHTALVENVSIGGMRLRGLPSVQPGTLMTVVFCGHEFDAATVRWCDKQSVGLRFSQRITRDQLAGLLTDDRFALTSIDFEKEAA